MKKFFNFVLYYFYRLFFNDRKIYFDNKKLNYFFHQYNKTYLNERVIEIPIVYKFVEQFKNKKILELGNVLSHYFSFKHDIVDKYEKSLKVINKDILDFNSKTKFNLIVSISTFEHIGFDEPKKDPSKPIKALNKLKTLLNKNGKIVITAPLGYNQSFDFLIINKKLKFDKTFFFKRISIGNKWKQINYSQIKNEKFSFGKPFPFANYIFIGIIG